MLHLSVITLALSRFSIAEISSLTTTSMPQDPRNNGWLPKLDPLHYRGHVVTFWTFVVNRRPTDWLNESFHASFREAMLHTCHRYRQQCAVYVLMPDHLHFLMLGVSEDSDQKRAISFLRSIVKPSPHSWQVQPHDHVLREHERTRGAFQKTAHYILENPVRKQLVASASDWPYAGAVLPGYIRMNPFKPDFWVKFWKAYWECRNSSS